MDTIQVLDKRFKLYMSAEAIDREVTRVAAEISRDLRGLNPLMLPVLSGSYVFAADLFRKIDFDFEISFVKFSSYSGTTSTGQLTEAIGFPVSVKDRHVVIVEDIVESGFSMAAMLKRLSALEPASIRVCTFFHKPSLFKENFKIDYIGANIPDDFIVGYGLDYNGLGRTYADIYSICED